jgi:integrase
VTATERPLRVAPPGATRSGPASRSGADDQGASGLAARAVQAATGATGAESGVVSPAATRYAGEPAGTELVPVRGELVSEAQRIAQRRALRAASAEFRRRKRRPNTLSAYESDWRHFEQWCHDQGVPSLPASPSDVADYLTYCALVERYSVATIERRLTSVSVRHRQAKEPTPRADDEVQETLGGIRVTLGVAQHGKEAARWYVVTTMVGTIDGDGLAATRDRAILLLGFAGAFRRSELVGLDVEDVRFDLEGVRLTLRRSKTDAEGAGRDVVVTYGDDGPDLCPVIALRRWLDASGVRSGPIFRGVDRWGKLRSGRLQGRHVATVVKRAAEALGLDPADWGGHSLRAGHITSAAVKGARDDRIMATSGHSSRQMVDRYTRVGRAFEDCSASYAMRDTGGRAAG